MGVTSFNNKVGSFKLFVWFKFWCSRESVSLLWRHSASCSCRKNVDNRCARQQNRVPYVAVSWDGWHVFMYGRPVQLNCQAPSDICRVCYIFSSWPNSLQWAMASTLSGSHDHTETHNIQPCSSGRVISSTQRHLPDSTQHSLETDIHATSGIRTRNPRKRAAADPRLRPRGYWGRHKEPLLLCNTLPCYIENKN